MASNLELCPDCGHDILYHPNNHPWPDGHTCNKCRGNPNALVGNVVARPLCYLTADEVARAVAAGSPECPNHDDPVLCKWDTERGRIIPEAGCPLHDLALHPRGDYSDYVEGRLNP
jgi:hypothetical protein